VYLSPSAGGSAVTTALTLTPVNGYTGTVTLSYTVTDINGTPAKGIGVSFNPLSPLSVVGGPITSTASVTADDGTWGGDYTVTVTGTDTNGVTATTTFEVNVEASFWLNGNPDTVTVPIGVAPGPSTTITLSPNDGYTAGVTLSASVSPDPVTGATVTASLGSNPVSAASPNSILTLTAPATTVPGTAIVTIVGTDPHGNQTSCSVQANVQSAGFTVGADPDSLTVIAGAESQPTSIFVTPMGAFTGPVTLVVTSITDPNGAAVTDLSDWALFDSSGTITSSVVSVPNSEIDTLEITAPPSVLAGVYSVTVTGTDSSGHTSAATINVDVPTGFSVTAEPGALTVAPGATAPVTIGVSAEGTESDNISFNSTVTDAYGNPVTGPAPSISFGGSIAIGSSAAETVTVPSLTAPGDYYIDVVGTDSGGNTSDAMIDVTVQTGGFIITPEESNLSIPVGTVSQQDTLTVSALGSFTGVVKLAAAVTNSAGTPVQGGLSASLADPSSVTLPSNNSDVLTVTAPPGTPVGQYMVTITGTDSNGNAVTSLIMVAVTAGYSLNASPTSLSLVAGSSGSSAITATAIGTGGGPVNLSAIVKDSNGVAVTDNSVTVQLSSPTVTIGSATPSVATVTTTGNVLSGSTYRVVVLGKDAGGAVAGTGFGVTIASASLTVSASPQTMNVAQGTQSEPETVTVNSTTGMTGNVTTTVTIAPQSGGACPAGLTSWFPASEPLDGTGTLTFTGTFNADTTVPAGTYIATITCTNGTSTTSATVTLVVAPIVLTITDKGFNPETVNLGEVGTDQLETKLSAANLSGLQVSYAWTLGQVWWSASDNPSNFTLCGASSYAIGWEDADQNIVNSPSVPNPIFTGCFFTPGYYSLQATCTATVGSGSNAQVVSSSYFIGGNPNDTGTSPEHGDEIPMGSKSNNEPASKTIPSKKVHAKDTPPPSASVYLVPGLQTPTPIAVPLPGAGPNLAYFYPQVKLSPDSVIKGFAITGCTWPQPTLCNSAYAPPSANGVITWTTTVPSIHPSFSASAQSGASATGVITASVPAGCPAGYYQVQYGATVNYTLKGVPQTPKAKQGTLTYVVGANTPLPYFKISIDRPTVKVLNKNGAVCEITLTSFNGFSGAVNLTSAPPNASGLAVYFFDTNAAYLPDNAATSPGPTSWTAYLKPGSTDTVTMTICACPGVPNADKNGNPSPSGTSAYTIPVTASGSNGVSSIADQANIGVWVLPAPAKKPGPPALDADFPGGIGRRVSTTGAFLGISGDATLPSCTPSTAATSGVSIDMCQGAKPGKSDPLADAADIYLGTISEGSKYTFDCDLGLTVGHSGKGWALIPNGKITKTDGPEGQTYSGTVHMALELPGFKRQANETIPKGASCNVNGVVQSGYLILQVNKDVYIFRAPEVDGALPVKRCNTIAQTLPPSMKAQGGFFQTGSFVLGAAWANLTVYNVSHPNGMPMSKDATKTTPAVGCKQVTYPGPPYVTYHVDSSFSDEDSINLSTVPLP